MQELPHGHRETIPPCVYESRIVPDPPERMLEKAKEDLAATDYYTLKYVDGELSAEEYEDKKRLRSALRMRVRELEAYLEKGSVDEA